MKRNQKKVLSTLLAAALVLTMIPPVAFAEGDSDGGVAAESAAVQSAALAEQDAEFTGLLEADDSAEQSELATEQAEPALLAQDVGVVLPANTTEATEVEIGVGETIDVAEETALSEIGGFEPLAADKVGFKGSVTIDDPDFLAAYRAADPAKRLFKVSGSGIFSVNSQNAWFYSIDANDGVDFDPITGTMIIDTSFDYPENWQSVAGGTFAGSLELYAFYCDSDGTMHQMIGTLSNSSDWPVGADSHVDYGSLVTSQFRSQSGEDSLYSQQTVYQVTGTIRVADPDVWAQFMAGDPDKRIYYLSYYTGSITFNDLWSFDYRAGNFYSPCGPIISSFDEQTGTLRFSLFPRMPRTGQQIDKDIKIFVGFAIDGSLRDLPPFDIDNLDAYFDAYYDLDSWGTNCAYILDANNPGSSLSVDLGTIVLGEEPDIVPSPEEPVLVEAPAEWNGTGVAAARIDAPLTDFIRLTLDGAEVDRSNYTLTEGSTIITFAEAYLKSLQSGEYTFTAEFAGGSVGIPLKVLAANLTDNNSEGASALPATGDEGISYLLIAVLLVLAGAGLLGSYRKSEAAVSRARHMRR
jgi:LPXTG-motif cell wall-anchored protein